MSSKNSIADYINYLGSISLEKIQKGDVQFYKNLDIYPFCKSSKFNCQKCPLYKNLDINYVMSSEFSWEYQLCLVDNNIKQNYLKLKNKTYQLEINRSNFQKAEKLSLEVLRLIWERMELLKQYYNITNNKEERILLDENAKSS